MFDLSGKTAIVTGALGLLGRQHCECLARAGATIVATDLDEGRCETLANELSVRWGCTAMGAGTDITDYESVCALRDRVLERFQHIDVLVNNAAVDDKVTANPSGFNLNTFEHYPLAAFRRALEVNVTGTFLGCQVLGTPMAERGQGSIINVASTYGLVAPDQRLYRQPDGSQQFFKSPVYPASKAAVIALTKFLASYWGAQGVRSNALCPGGVRHEQPQSFIEAYSTRTPLGRMATPDDYHGALVFLASDASRYMTGATLVVDGGFTVW